MPRYTFTSLSAQDFEELVRDLLQAEWDVPIEAFKTGRDNGIDLRYASADDGVTIVQCKHYTASGVSTLISHLRRIELPKVVQLRPVRYVMATSCGLTPANKNKIVAAMQPFIQRTGDVLGAQDLEGLLRRHPSVEKTNFKLWLTSTSVLERVLHNAEQCHTDFEIERIRRKLPLFVQSAAFPRAKKLLDTARIAVISGIPGIGKTTLAELLLYAHLEQGYQPIVIQGHISEGKKFFRPTEKQIFYYDDFLGQIFLGDRKEYLGRNEDAAIVDFMEMIQRSKHSRFILTTREHILRSALQVSERFAHSLLLADRCIIELEDYSYAQKARILYNHLYFSDLPQPYRDAVLENRFFLNVIKHEHFNPRLIEWLSAYTRVKDIPPDSYQSHISALLEKPENIWSHAFGNQISNAARHLLLVLYTVGQGVATVGLELAFIDFRRHCAGKYNEHIVAGEFRRALQELDGAFLSYDHGYVSFLNPAIREFVASVVTGDRNTAEDLLTSAVRFRQVVTLWELAKAQPETALPSVFRSELDLLLNVLTRLLPTSYLRWEKMRDGSPRGRYIDMDFEGEIGFLIDFATDNQAARIAELAVRTLEGLAASWNHNTPDFAVVIHLFTKIGKNTWFLARGGRQAYRNLVDSLMNKLDYATADDWLAIIEFPDSALDWTEGDGERFRKAINSYCTSGVDDEIYSSTTVDELSALRDSLDELMDKYALNLKYALDRVEEELAELDETRETDDERSFGGGRSIRHEEVMSDKDVAEMFNTLRESISS